MYIEDEEGNRIPAEDGDYVTSDAKTIVVADGKVSEIKDPEAEVETEFGSKATDKGELSWEGEEDLKEGDAVFMDGEPAPDGEYRTEDGKVIVVVDGKVAEIRDDEAEVAPEEAPAEVEELRKENAQLKKTVAELSKQVEKLSRQSAAKPAHEEFSEAGKSGKTGRKGLDRFARYVDAMK